MDEPVISTAANRPDLFRRASELTADLWPVYNTHGDVLSQYWAHLEEAFPQFQFTVHDANWRTSSPRAMRFLASGTAAWRASRRALMRW